MTNDTFFSCTFVQGYIWNVGCLTNYDTILRAFGSISLFDKLRLIYEMSTLLRGLGLGLDFSLIYLIKGGRKLIRLSI